MSDTIAVVYDGITWHFRYADTYCPRCGHHGMWLAGDDYYVGATGHCLACQHTHQCAADFAAFDAFAHAAAAAIQARWTAPEPPPRRWTPQPLHATGDEPPQEDTPDA